MSLWLAFDQIILSHGDDLAVRLRPSLRAGLLIAERYPLAELERHLEEGHIGVIGYLIMLGCDDFRAAEAFTSAVMKAGLRHLVALAPDLIGFAALSLGTAGEPDDEDAASTTTPKSLTDSLTELYEFAAGALQWTPAEAWAATPAEIVHARNGHFAMLRAIHGSGEEGDEGSNQPAPIPTETQVRDNIAGLKAAFGSAIAERA